jgi:hypothetical protein
MTGHTPTGGVAFAHGVARHMLPERFQTYAAAQLAACPPWTSGRCFNPACGRAFAPARDWQIYCSTGCERTGTSELRAWGHRMALPLLVWRMGKYERADAGLRDLSRVARRYVGHVQSVWLADRVARAAAAAEVPDGV